MSMKDELAKRLPKASETLINHICTVIGNYDLKVSVNNFDEHGLFFLDKKKRKVRVVVGTPRYDSKNVHLPNPNSDVAIIFFEGLLVGWVETDKLEDLKDRFSIPIKSLNPMPESFEFKQTCAHMSVHGGFYDGEYWECAGCGLQLIYKEDE